MFLHESIVCSFTHSAVEGHLGCFHFLVTMNRTAINIRVQVFVWTCLISLRYILKCGMAGLQDKCIFNFMKHCQAVFRRDCVILHFHKQCMRNYSYQYPFQDFVFLILYIFSHFNGWAVLVRHDLNLCFPNG